MTDVIAKTIAFGLLGVAVICYLLYLTKPTDKPHPDAPRCWCEAFSTPSTDCYCVSFADGAE